MQHTMQEDVGFLHLQFNIQHRMQEGGGPPTIKHIIYNMQRRRVGGGCEAAQVGRGLGHPGGSEPSRRASMVEGPCIVPTSAARRVSTSALARGGALRRRRLLRCARFPEPRQPLAVRIGLLDAVKVVVDDGANPFEIQLVLIAIVSVEGGWSIMITCPSGSWSFVQRMAPVVTIHAPGQDDVL